MKKLFQSKTVLFAVLFFAVSVAGLFGYADYTPGSDLTEIVNIAVSVVMLVLRLATSKGIEL